MLKTNFFKILQLLRNIMVYLMSGVHPGHLRWNLVSHTDLKKIYLRDVFRSSEVYQSVTCIGSHANRNGVHVNFPSKLM